VISGESGALSSGAQPVKSQKPCPLREWRSRQAACSKRVSGRYLPAIQE